MMKQSPPIQQNFDYTNYARNMRAALSGPEINKEGNVINHAYFNTKKGYYWSEANNASLEEGLRKHGTNWTIIREQIFNKSKTEVQIELRACLLLKVRDSRQITDQMIKDLSKQQPQQVKVTRNKNKKN